MLKFKAYLAERQIKQREVAQTLGITIQNANRKINGKEPFTLDQVKILCKKYKLSADEYFL
jgi:plasmid maintenance system antidote protein VapI